jgi:hypothetical protein
MRRVLIVRLRWLFFIAAMIFRLFLVSNVVFRQFVPFRGPSPLKMAV